MKKILALVLLSLIFFCGTGYAATKYVNASTGDNSNSGDTPAEAWGSISYAAGAVNEGDQILVAPGIYDSDSNGESFPISLKNGVQLTSTVTLGATIDAGSSSSNVVEMAVNSKIEGFIIKTSGSGSGVYVGSGINGVTISRNEIIAETGIEFKSNNYNCIVSYNDIKSNDEKGKYGIIASKFANGNIIYNKIGPSFEDGAWIQPLTGDCVIINNTFAMNDTGLRIGPQDYLVTCKNNIFYGSTEKALWVTASAKDFVATYCCFYGNVVDVEGGVAGEGCIFEDPLFVDVEGGDFHLTISSPCIDAGDPASPTDPDESRADMGCYSTSAWAGQPPLVQVTSPNGGETWEIGGQYNITWTATQPVEPVQSINIYYSIDGGITFPFTIITGTTNDGIHPWTVTNTPTTQAKVKVEALSSVGVLGSDESDAVFTIIVGTFEVGPSLSGISLPTYTKDQTIPVDALGVTGSPTHMMVSENSDFSGATWILYVDPTNFTLSAGDGTKTVYYKLKDGSDTESNIVSSSTILDQTPPIIDIVSPNGGENWLSGTNHEIKWSASDSVSGIKDNSIVIYYSTDGGQTYPNIITSGAPNTGSFNWIVPNLDENDVKIKITVSDNAGNQGEDESSGNFEISTQVEDARIISGIITHPRPYSPSKDGICNIIYSLNKNTDVTIYIYGAREIVWKKEIIAGEEGGKKDYNAVPFDSRGMYLGNGILVVQIYAKGSSLRKLGTGHMVVFE
jgi:hypothetical protein